MKPCKEVCKRCQNYIVISNCFFPSLFSPRWREGWAWCELARGYGWFDIKEIPEDCPYCLEHTVMGNKQK